MWLCAVIRWIARGFDDLTREEQRHIIKKIIKKITVSDQGDSEKSVIIISSLFNYYENVGGATQNRTGDQGVAVHCLTAWLWHRMERMTRLELATSTLARWRSTR